ncbi:peptide deformylase [Streptococcus massiliensis]|uniref:Peptide deformylase n=1 Tax=Streptococcus massiliensis TaxID=313439 RepID=A0A380KZN4_9STRE|nr:peptide deformylase [Streptococcus massiliensis]
MITKIKNESFLQVPSELTTPNDLYLAQYLSDTPMAHKEHCVGIAVNMIGSHKRVIIIDLGFTSLVMFNLKIIRKSGIYRMEESCLSLIEIRSTKRYQNITA